jgi:hypothetical protein
MPKLTVAELEKTVAELKLRLDGYENKTAEVAIQLNEQNERTNQLSKDVVINARYNNDQKDIKKTFGDIDKVINDERVTTKVFYVSVIFVSIIFFLFGFVVGDSCFLKFGGETTITETTTETTTVVKPNKTTDLKKIVDKMTTGDRQKLSDCIEKAIESDATEAYKLRENLHDNIIESFRDPEEKIWQPFRQYIVTRNPVDSYESAKNVYETIKTALQREVKESW